MCDLLEILLCHVVKLWYNIAKQTFLWTSMGNVLKHGQSVNFMLY